MSETWYSWLSMLQGIGSISLGATFLIIIYQIMKDKEQDKESC
jgi:hypothetical protein